MCPIWKNRMSWLLYQFRNPLSCVIWPYVLACVHAHTNKQLIHLRKKSHRIPDLSYRWLKCPNHSRGLAWGSQLWVCECVSVLTLTPSPQCSCRLARLTVGYDTWFGCWQLALFLGNENITSVLVHSALTIKKIYIYLPLFQQLNLWPGPASVW